MRAITVFILITALLTGTGCALLKAKNTPARSVEKAQVLYWEGIDAYTSGKLDKAVLIWKKALSLDPSNAGVQRDLKKVKAEIAELNKRK
jgi:outer membrane protein assembly factor BamD (BamD/ComL family)